MPKIIYIKSKSGGYLNVKALLKNAFQEKNV